MTWRRYIVPASLIASAAGAVILAFTLHTLPLPYLAVGPTDYPEVSELHESHLSPQEYSDYFRRVAQKKGAVYAYKVLGVVPLPTGTDAHSLGHVVGDVLYAQQGITGMEYCTQDFRNACSHSVMIGFLQDHGPAALKDAAAVCDQAPGGKAGWALCFHGIGHGLLAYNGYDLKKTVAMCQTLKTPLHDNEESPQCVGGSIMEMMSGTHDLAEWRRQSALLFKESDPLYPCDADWMPEEVQPSCYVQITARLFLAAGGPMTNVPSEFFPDAFSFCALIPESQNANRSQCYAGFGKEFVIYGNDLRALGTLPNAELQKLRTWCAMAGTEDGERSCDSSVLGTLFWGGEQSADSSFRFCALAQENLANPCYIELARQIATYHPGTKEGAQLCAKLPAGYRPFCQNI
jgi:hypothetical protein